MRATKCSGQPLTNIRSMIQDTPRSFPTITPHLDGSSDFQNHLWITDLELWCPRCFDGHGTHSLMTAERRPICEGSTVTAVLFRCPCCALSRAVPINMLQLKMPGSSLISETQLELLSLLVWKVNKGDLPSTGGFFLQPRRAGLQSARVSEG